MSSSGPSNGQAKRHHDGTEDGQPAHKSSRTNEAPPEQQEEIPHLRKGSRKRRILRGPNGEAMIPDSFPLEWADSRTIDVLNIPTGWDFILEDDHGMTLGSREWWEDYGPWLDTHKEALKLSAEIWKMKDKAMPGCYFEEWGFSGKFAEFVEKEEDEDDEEGQAESNTDIYAEKEDDNRPYNKLASLYPEWPWYFTMRGVDRSRWWLQECLKRDPDNFYDLCVGKKFSAYGALEVLENIIAKFDSVFRPKSTYRDFWPEVEGLAMFLHGGVLDYDGIGDGKRRQMTNEIIGYLILATIDALEQQDVFKPDSEIRNLGLVLFMFIQWKLSHCYVPAESLFWMCKIVELAEEANVKLTSPHNFEKDCRWVKTIRDRGAKRMDKWENVDWQSQLREFKDNTGSTKFGGDYFDITIMTQDDRNQREREWRRKVQIR
ncbi:hypothetical protein FANTH_618 [Fusarium anthophilum]|uniref:Uncharacterized protein n=1 Tax=Fusarium anthophilum TaxID=48485 RepID=A0A8H4ZZG7_9HYPO|nr:hypothetical protein FANTH_618 [Fusarium anthophilum]